MKILGAQTASQIKTDLNLKDAASPVKISSNLSRFVKFELATSL
ncbi:hypothetical protein [uncultured Campylobacter sp.]|nr:hypothetical protein [uncultured Campylobacter sp.]